MSLQEYYEDSFISESRRRPEDLLDEVVNSSRGLAKFVIESKSRFLPEANWQGLKVLELGSGRGGVGLQLARMGADVTLVDFSATALEQAQSLFDLEGHNVRTVVADVTHPDIALGVKYDLIVDSHLLHCLTEDPDRASYYGLISENLTSKGIFVAETMVYRKKLTIPDGFMFDQRNVLWQMFGKWIPVRRILDSLDLEKEIQSADLHITFFYYYGQYSFVPHKTFLDLPDEILPAAVRMVLSPKQE
jgi:SAM-dependent methyltransferase